VQTALGFTLTLFTIHLMPYLIDALGWRYAFLPLAVGPAAGIWRWPGCAPIQDPSHWRAVEDSRGVPPQPAAPAEPHPHRDRVWSCASGGPYDARAPARICAARFVSGLPTEANMSYHLEGRLLEVCNCRVLCPCWIGEDPDFGTCDTIVAWHFDKGTIDGVDVAGRTIAMIAHVPGNILQGNWTAAVYLDDKVTKAQEEALLAVYTGKKGGPIADLAKLVGKVVSVEKVPSHRSPFRVATERSSSATPDMPSSSRTRARPVKRRR
jgi:hypothetical protein